MKLQLDQLSYQNEVLEKSMRESKVRVNGLESENSALQGDLKKIMV